MSVNIVYVLNSFSVDIMYAHCVDTIDAHWTWFEWMFFRVTPIMYSLVQSAWCQICLSLQIIFIGTKREPLSQVTYQCNVSEATQIHRTHSFDQTHQWGNMEWDCATKNMFSFPAEDWHTVYVNTSSCVRFLCMLTLWEKLYQFIYNNFAHTHTHTHTWTHTRTHTHMHTWTHTHAHTNTHTHTHTHMHTWTHTRTHKHTHTRTHEHTWTHTRTHKHTHTRTHTHTHTHTLLRYTKWLVDCHLTSDCFSVDSWQSSDIRLLFCFQLTSDVCHGVKLLWKKKTGCGVSTHAPPDSMRWGVHPIACFFKETFSDRQDL